MTFRRMDGNYSAKVDMRKPTSTQSWGLPLRRAPSADLGLLRQLGVAVSLGPDGHRRKAQTGWRSAVHGALGASRNEIRHSRSRDCCVPRAPSATADGLSVRRSSDDDDIASRCSQGSCLRPDHAPAVAGADDSHQTFVERDRDRDAPVSVAAPVRRDSTYGVEHAIAQTTPAGGVSRQLRLRRSARRGQWWARQ